MVLSGGSQCYQVSISILDKFEANCQLPFTLQPNEDDRRNWISFWYRILSKTNIERTLLTPTWSNKGPVQFVSNGELIIMNSVS